VIRTIARRELADLFHSSLAWVLLAAHQVLLAWIFLRVVERFSGLEAAQRTAGITQELTLNLFGVAAVLALFTVPLLTMRLLSGELRRGTFALLASSPVSLTQILLGKLVGLGGYLAVLTVLPLALGLALLPWVRLDLGLLAAATLGLALVQTTFAAVGLFASAAAGQPATAAAGAYGLLLMLSVIGRAASPDGIGGFVLLWLSWNEHFLPFLLGQVQTLHLAYFLILSALFLTLALRRLERRRSQG
jgi:ABC-2 type transport system permease protein